MTLSRQSETQHGRSNGWKKLAILGAVAILTSAVFWQFSDALDYKNIAARETQLRDYRALHPVLVLVLAFLIYTAVAGTSIPVGASLSVVFGWFFGFWSALLLVSFASTTGATFAFLLSRYLFRDALQAKLGARLAIFNEALQREGPFYLFTLRLIPAVPFWLINLVMGLTPIRAATFWWVSQLGMIPGTILFVFFGSRLPNLQTLADEGARSVLTADRIAALVLLGVVPLIIRYTIKRFTKN